MCYKLTLLRGEGLVAKDRSLGFMGKKNSSDPYVEVFANGKKIGTAPTQKKTLNPVWKAPLNQFEVEFEGDKVEIALKIWDEDKLSAPDAMGTLRLNLLPPNHYYPQPITNWYDVPKESAKNASGKLQIRLHSPKFVTLRGVRMLNPVYKKWKAAQNE